VNVLRWVGGIVVAALGTLILLWCTAVIAWDDNYDHSVTPWHVWAVAAVAAGVIALAVRSVARQDPWSLPTALVMLLAAYIGVFAIIGGSG
jgi:hypothetical protein